MLITNFFKMKIPFGPNEPCVCLVPVFSLSVMALHGDQGVPYLLFIDMALNCHSYLGSVMMSPADLFMETFKFHLYLPMVVSVTRTPWSWD